MNKPLLNHDYELEKRYHPENFGKDEYIEFDLLNSEKTKEHCLLCVGVMYKMTKASGDAPQAFLICPNCDYVKEL